MSPVFVFPRSGTNPEMQAMAEPVTTDFALAEAAYNAWFRACPELARTHLEFLHCEPDLHRRWIAGVRAVRDTPAGGELSAGETLYEAWMAVQGLPPWAAHRFADLGPTAQRQFEAAGRTVRSRGL